VYIHVGDLTSLGFVVHAKDGNGHYGEARIGRTHRHVALPRIAGRQGTPVAEPVRRAVACLSAASGNERPRPPGAVTVVGRFA